MANFLHPDAVSLDDLAGRIKTSDLVPSRAALLDGLDQNIAKFSRQGIASLDELQKTLKNAKKMEALAQSTGIDQQYLVLLRREVESYMPKPFKLIEVDWLPREQLSRLIDAGIGNSDDLRAAAQSEDGITRLVEKTGVEQSTLDYLVSLADLGTVQWVSLNFARMLVEAGYPNARSVATADAEVLCERLDQINVGGKYFNGKVGLRDIKRLVHAASYVV